MEQTERKPHEWLAFYLGRVLGFIGSVSIELVMFGGCVFFWHHKSEVGFLMVIALTLITIAFRVK